MNKKQQKRQPQPAWANWVKIIVLGVWAIWFFGSIYLNLIARPTWPAAIQNYTTPNPSPQFQHIWALDNAFSGRDALGSIVLTATKEEVLFYGDFHPNEPVDSLQRLNLLTGGIKDIINVSRRAEGIVSNNRFIYVSNRSGNKIDSETLQGAAQVVAYDIESGQQVWSQRIRGARGIASMSVYEDIVTVVGETATVNRYQHLNVSTGRVTYSNDSEYPVLYSGDIWYVIRFKPIEYLVAIQSRTNTPLWEQKSIYPHDAPSLSNGVIVGRSGGRIGYAYGVDRGTGMLLWLSDDVVYSNVSISNGIAYFLTGQAQLKAVDVRTGQTLATMHFVPETVQEQLTQQRVYNVAVSGDIVVVYLGDSRQLFAFRFVR